MWASFFNLVRRVFTIDDELNRLRADLKEVRREVRDLTTAMTRLHYEMQVQKEHMIHEREKQALRGEIEQLRSRLGLPPAPLDKGTNE